MSHKAKPEMHLTEQRAVRREGPRGTIRNSKQQVGWGTIWSRFLEWGPRFHHGWSGA